VDDQHTFPQHHSLSHTCQVAGPDPALSASIKHGAEVDDQRTYFIERRPAHTAGRRQIYALQTHVRLGCDGIVRVVSSPAQPGCSPSEQRDTSISIGGGLLLSRSGSANLNRKRQGWGGESPLSVPQGIWTGRKEEVANIKD